MSAPARSPQIAVLVLGDPSVVQARAHGLRLRGFAAFVAQDEAELTWLLSVARVRPDYAVVDLSTTADPVSDRVTRLVAMARLATLASLPVVLVGAGDDEARFFRRVLARFPRDPGDAAILSVLAKSAA
ncbi:MAG: hypothetical protein F9K40_22420 [Kofleriaceae bacterium]|nr:MAG: hypothetical protein F9K40_22420 [Kofleriaceae bacterium]MBZ0233524.1 hypothetical protein [Kofleriaceae bacterium]